MTLLHLAVVVVIFILVVIAIRYFGPRFKNPSPGPPPGPAPRELYVADEGDTAIWILGINDVNSTLQVPPLRSIMGGALGDVGQTQLRYPNDMSVDGGGTVFVLNQEEPCRD